MKIIKEEVQNENVALTEDYSYTKEMIYNYIDDVETLYHDLRDSIYTLSVALEEQYPDEASYAKGALTNYLEDFGSSLFAEIEDIKNVLDPPEEDEVEEKLEESTLTEKNWKYKIDSELSKKLRDSIDDENYEVLRECLKAIWGYIHEILPEEFDEDELEEKINDIDFLDIEPNEEIDLSQEDVEDNWNYELNDLYDFCDAFNIWIEI